MTEVHLAWLILGLIGGGLVVRIAGSIAEAFSRRRLRRHEASLRALAFRRGATYYRGQ